MYFIFNYSHLGMCNILLFVYIILLESILFIIYIQHTTHNFTEFIPNYIKSNITSNNILINNQNNNQSQIINYQNDINELKIQLNEEKNKNLILNKEIEILKNINIILNNDNNSLKEKIKILENDLILKNNELQNLLSKNNNNIINYEITSIKPDEKILCINFVCNVIQDMGHYNLVCKNTDLFVRLEERLYQDFPSFKNYETYFEVNTRRIKRFKTIDENNIKNNDIVNVFRIEE